MAKRYIRPLVLMLILLMIDNVEAFRRLSSREWAVNKDDPTIWVRFSAEDLQQTMIDTGFKDGSTPLSGISAANRISETIRLVFEDYNRVEGSYLRLAFYPVDGFDFAADPADSPFDQSLAEIRTINVGNGGARTVEAGHAIPKFDTYRFIGCDINIVGDNFLKAEVLKKILTHEIGHCLGFDHNHADDNSIMSYLADSAQHSLGIDDKIGIIDLYPSELTTASEKNTMGLSCNTKN